MEVLPCPVSVDFSSSRGGYRDCAPDDAEDDGGASQALARRLEDELRAAKSAQLACGEVLLPADLLPRVARDVLRMAENEPCGLRGCTLFINFENDQVCKRIGMIKCDPRTVSTFELYLTLKQDSSSWHSLLPQFLKNLTRGGTIMISQGFTLEKKKLYRSYLE
ncbi:protein charybde-like isoform X2 [Periplaneta americana]|uniref:protein charybde-like isoform X2 n=1 Tax=Periplaneta americana TaxID=6978 RepID=UPI0037E9712D